MKIKEWLLACFLLFIMFGLHSAVHRKYDEKEPKPSMENLQQLRENNQKLEQLIQTLKNANL